MFKKIHLNEITILFFLILVLCGLIKKAIYIIAILFIHEIGHVLVCMIFNIKIEKIDIYPFGGIIKLDKPINGIIWKDIMLALGGIIMQLFLMIFSKGEFNLINKEILLFNLLPIIPLDGSKIVFELTNLFFSFKKSMKIYIIISIISSIIYIYFNYCYHLDNYLIIGLFISKTYEMIKNEKIIFNKFIMERQIYDLPYLYIKKGVGKNNIKKQIKYYYFVNGKIVSEKEYLSKFVC